MSHDNDLIPLARDLLYPQCESITDKYVADILMQFIERGVPHDQLQAELERYLSLALESVVDKIGRRN